MSSIDTCCNDETCSKPGEPCCDSSNICGPGQVCSPDGVCGPPVNAVELLTVYYTKGVAIMSVDYKVCVVMTQVCAPNLVNNAVVLVLSV